ncbi:MAG: hypothetical protein QXV61_00020 [Archaeoglobaceae archaeon]
MSESRNLVTLSVRIQRKELQAFERAVRADGRFMNRSDALRYLIRKFSELVGDQNE